MNGKRLAFAVVLATARVVAALGGEPFEAEIACGPSALALSARLVDRSVTDVELKAAFENNLAGPHSFEQLEEAAKRLGLTTRLVRLDPEAPRLERFPLIAALATNRSNAREEDHFVVIHGHFGSSLQILDPPHAPLFASLGSTARLWDGWGLYVSKSSRDFAGNVDRPKWVALVAVAAGVLLAVVGARGSLRGASATSRNGNPAAR